MGDEVLNLPASIRAKEPVTGVGVAKPERVQQPVALTIDAYETAQDHLGDDMLVFNRVGRCFGRKLLYPEQYVGWRLAWASTAHTRIISGTESWDSRFSLRLRIGPDEPG